MTLLTLCNIHAYFMKDAVELENGVDLNLK